MTAKVIDEGVNAEIIAVIEAEDRPSLLRFNEELLDKKYRHIMLVDGNDPRGIDVGIMTKSGFPIRTIRSNVDAEDAQGIVFSRDCPEYEVVTQNGTQLFILVNHFKSQSGGGGPKRKRQAMRCGRSSIAWSAKGSTSSCSETSTKDRRRRSSGRQPRRALRQQQSARRGLLAPWLQPRPATRHLRLMWDPEPARLHLHLCRASSPHSPEVRFSARACGAHAKPVLRPGRRIPRSRTKPAGVGPLSRIHRSQRLTAVARPTPDQAPPRRIRPRGGGSPHVSLHFACARARARESRAAPADQAKARLRRAFARSCNLAVRLPTTPAYSRGTLTAADCVVELPLRVPVACRSSCRPVHYQLHCARREARMCLIR